MLIRVRRCPFLSILFVLFPKSPNPVHRGHQLSTQPFKMFLSFTFFVFIMHHQRYISNFMSPGVLISGAKTIQMIQRFLCVGLQTAVFLKLVFVFASALQRHVAPCSSTLMSVIICNLLICRDDNNPATCLPDYQCIMLRLYSGAFQRFSFMQQAETSRSRERKPSCTRG